jgi:hypothetical protein
MTTSQPPAEQVPEDDTALLTADDATLLTAALNHAWAWYDGRISRAFQVVNYYFLASAILGAAYTGAINAKNHGLAAAIAVGQTGLEALAYIAWSRELNAAAPAEPALIDVQERMAGRLKMPSMRIAGKQHEIQLWRTLARTGFGLAALLSVGGLIYAVIL